MKNIIPPIKGTRDFYPEDMSIRTWLYSKLREVSNLYGYQEYEGPILEAIDLYAAKSGEELVKEQSFVFPDRSGDLITLRPELTPTLARMVAQRQKQLVYPLRWWSFGPFWRYERPQKGRTREFFQWNIDLIGANAPEADAEMIAIIATFFQTVGLSSEQVKILINDRKLIESELNRIDIPDNQYKSVFKLVDRKEKMPGPEWRAYAKEIGLSERNIDDLEALLTDSSLWKKSANLSRVFSALDALKVSKYTKFDPNIIRGLDYYTSTVFEAKENQGDIRRSILGGGRYDNLLADVGGDPLPAVGFAMGDVIITLLLKANNCLPQDINRLPADVLVTIFDKQYELTSLAFATEMRQARINTLCHPIADSLGKQLKYASRLGVKMAVIIGPDEIHNSEISIKDLTSGAQLTVARKDAISQIQSLLENEPA